MNPPPNYSVLAAKAEKAVEKVKDPKLRRLAFQKILDDLLAAGSSARARKDGPATGKLTASKEVENKGVAKRRGPQFYVEELASNNFFKKPKTIGQVKIELENGGHHIPITSLSGPLQILCQRKILRRQRVADGKKRQTFAYSNW